MHRGGWRGGKGEVAGVWRDLAASSFDFDNSVLLSRDRSPAPVNHNQGEHKSEDYSKKFPRGTVPAIADGDFYLDESSAIMCVFLPSK